MMTAPDQEGAVAPVPETTLSSPASASAHDTNQGSAPDTEAPIPSRENSKNLDTDSTSSPETTSASTPPSNNGSANKPPKSKRSSLSRDERRADYVFFDPGLVGSIKVTMEVPIGSDLGQNAIETYLPQLEAIIPKLYNFVEKRLRYGHRHIRSYELSKMIDERMNRSFSIADNQIKVNSLEKRLTKAGIDFRPLFESRTVTVQFSTPHARNFIEGVQMHDRIATLYQLAWVAGLVDTAEQRESFFKSTAVIGAAFNRVNNMMKAVERGINPLIESGRRDGKSRSEVEKSKNIQAGSDVKTEDESPSATKEVVETEGEAFAS